MKCYILSLVILYHFLPRVYSIGIKNNDIALS